MLYCSMPMLSGLSFLAVFSPCFSWVVRNWSRVNNGLFSFSFGRGTCFFRFDLGVVCFNFFLIFFYGSGRGIVSLPSLVQFRQHPWSHVSTYSKSFVMVFFSNLGLGDGFVHHPPVFRPPQLQQVQALPPKSQFAKGQLELDGWDPAKVILEQGVS